MYFAINAATGDWVEAEDLWHLDTVDQNGYACPSCGTKLTPCSYKRENLRRPYFSAKVGNEHRKDCDIDGKEKEVLARARKVRVSDASGQFPTTYPSQLVFREHRPVVNPALGIKKPTNSTATQAPSLGKTGSPGTYSRSKVYSIRPICRFFLNTPHDRHLKLEIPGIKGNTYGTVFRGLWWKELKSYSETRIYYAPVHWKGFIETQQTLEIFLNAGERNEDGSLKLEHCHRLIVNWSDWSPKTRNALKKEIKAAIYEAKEAHAENKNKKPWIFFVPTRFNNENWTFSSESHFMICCLSD